MRTRGTEVGCRRWLHDQQLVVVVDDEHDLAHRLMLGLDRLDGEISWSQRLAV
jgi:hypothetical protein